MQHVTPRQVVSSLALKPTKDFQKEIQMNLWHQRKVRKSDYFSHLFLISMVSVFDSSHIPTCASVGFGAGRLSDLHYEQVSWPIQAAQNCLLRSEWVTQAELSAKEISDSNLTLTNKKSSHPSLHFAQLQPGQRQRKGHRLHWRNRIRVAGPDGVRDSWMD